MKKNVIFHYLFLVLSSVILLLSILSLYFPIKKVILILKNGITWNHFGSMCFYTIISIIIALISVLFMHIAHKYDETRSRKLILFYFTLKWLKEQLGA